MSNNGVYGLLAGGLGFCIAPLSDWASLKRNPYVKSVIILLLVIIWSYALYAVSFGKQSFDLPWIASGLGWFLLAISFSLSVYSSFIEIRSAKTGARPRAEDRLVTTGFYALTRHPGVLWFGLFLVALLLVSKSSILILAAPIWLLMDMLWVLLQDKYLFLLMFKDYRQYQRETPMLIPTKQSIHRCLKTLNAGGRK